LLLAVLGAFVPGPATKFEPVAKTVQIGLVAGPIHYDFLLPATKQTRAVFGFAKAAGVPVAHIDVEWIVIGWGARGFYTTVGGYSDLTLDSVLRGILGDTAVLRVDVATRLPDDFEMRRVGLSGVQYAALLRHIRSELEDVPVELATSGFTATDAFYSASGRFNIVRTCNVWVAETLRAAGVGFGVWTPTPYAVSLSHWWHSALDPRLAPARE